MASKEAVAEEAGKALLTQAVKLDEEGEQLDKAVNLYTEGVAQLIKAMKEASDEGKKKRLMARINDYLTRAEELKKIAKSREEANKQHTLISIADNSTGHSYENLFGKFIDERVTYVEVEDPYIHSRHQVENFLRLCELCVKKCPALKRIHLTTQQAVPQRGYTGITQQEALGLVERSLAEHRVQFTINFSKVLHDRVIRLDTGWIIQMGRGLDIYKKLEKNAIGSFDCDLRPCHETTLNIFHNNSVINEQSKPT